MFYISFFFFIKFLFRMKMFFAANNIYFVKDTNISLLKKKFFFALVLQQMNNHIGIHITIKKSYLVTFLVIYNKSS